MLLGPSRKFKEESPHHRPSRIIPAPLEPGFSFTVRHSEICKAPRVSRYPDDCRGPKPLQQLARLQVVSEQWRGTVTHSPKTERGLQTRPLAWRRGAALPIPLNYKPSLQNGSGNRNQNSAALFFFFFFKQSRYYYQQLSSLLKNIFKCRKGF